MAKNKIKFNYQFQKLFFQTMAILIAVEEIFTRDLPEEFLDYDLELDGFNCQALDYKRPVPSVLLLTFQGNNKIPFTTVRRNSVSSSKRYFSNIGQEYEIVVEPVVKKETSSTNNQVESEETNE